MNIALLVPVSEATPQYGAFAADRFGAIAANDTEQPCVPGVEVIYLDVEEVELA